MPRAEDRDAFTSHYATQRSDAATKFVKQLFNWRLSAEERSAPLDELLDFAFSGRSPRWHDVYLDELGVRTLVNAGMGVGPHSHSHEVASRIPVDRQGNEIALSCKVIESIGGSRMWGYCHPHGSPDAFLDQTEEAIAEAGCPFAFAVRPFDVDSPLADTRRYALPRHNCNAFPHGAAYSRPGRRGRIRTLLKITLSGANGRPSAQLKRLSLDITREKPFRLRIGINTGM